MVLLLLLLSSIKINRTIVFYCKYKLSGNVKRKNYIILNNQLIDLQTHAIKVTKYNKYLQHEHILVRAFLHCKYSQVTCFLLDKHLWVSLLLLYEDQYIESTI